MSVKPFYLAGRWITSTQPLNIHFPYNNEIIDTISLADSESVSQAIQKAHDSKEKTSQMTPYQRTQVLKFIVWQLEEQHEDFSQLLTRENGKTIRESRTEISRTITTFNVAVGEAERIYGESYDLGVNQLSEGRHAIVKKFPIGVIAGIAPFNFPMNLAAHKIAPAIATGCPIVLKPASSTPLTMLKFAKIIENSGWPKEAFSVLPCDRSVGQQLVEDPRISLLSFTGSPHVGWKMKSQAGKKKTVLELGGNAAVVIDKSVQDWDAMIARVAVGAFYQAGQVCISTQRIYVHADVAIRFMKDFQEEVKALKVGDPREEDVDMGSMIDQKNTNRMQEWVGEAVDQGAQCILGHRYNGTVMSPTVLTGVSESMKVYQEEVFGAVVSIFEFTDFDWVLDQVNNSDFGLQTGVYTDSQSNIWKAFHQLEVGGVIHNDIPGFRNDMMPYGGVKDSWLGREGVRYAMQDMLEERVLVLSK